MTASKLRVLCVDDHQCVLDGLRTRLKVEPDIEFVGGLHSAKKLVANVQTLRPHVVIIDIEMPGPDMFAAMADMVRQCPGVRPIMLSAHVRDRYLDDAYDAGAWGYLSKSDSPEQLIAAIRRVAAGEAVMSPIVAARAQPRQSRTTGVKSKRNELTPREREVLRLIGRGLGRREIADQLSRSPMTVDNHRKSIMRKLSIRSRPQLIHYAINEGFV